MKVITGDEYGLIKCVDITKKLVESKFGEMNKDNEIVSIQKIAEDENLLFVVEKYQYYVLDWATHEKISTSANSKEKKIQNNAQIVKNIGDSKLIIVSNSSNVLEINNLDEDFKFNNHANPDTDSDNANNESKTIIELTQKNLQNIKNNKNANEIFCLFKDSPVIIYDINNNKQSWKAKNLPHDELDLQVKMWDTDLAQLNSNPNHFYTSTAYGEIRFYDRKVRPRPIFDKEIMKRKINRMTLSNCETYLTVGDVNGNIFMYDRRKGDKLAIAKSLKGSTGAIKDIQHVLGSNGKVVSCGLDRYLRVFDFKTYEDLPQIYLKNCLNCVCLYDVNKESLKEDDDDEENSEDIDSEGDGEEDEFEEMEDEDDFNGEVDDEEDDNEEEDDVDDDFEEI